MSKRKVLMMFFLGLFINSYSSFKLESIPQPNFSKVAPFLAKHIYAVAGTSFVAICGVSYAVYKYFTRKTIDDNTNNQQNKDENQKTRVFKIKISRKPIALNNDN